MSVRWRRHIATEFELNHDVQRFIQQLRERVRRIDRQGSQNRPNLAVIVMLQEFQVRGLKLLETAEGDSSFGEGGLQFFAPAAILHLDHATDALGDGAEGLGGGEAIDSAFHDVRFDLLFHAGDADFEELVEVRAADAKELHPLEQRGFRIERLVQDPLVELQPAQFPVEKTCGWRAVRIRTTHWQRR